MAASDAAVHWYHALGFVLVLAGLRAAIRKRFSNKSSKNRRLQKKNTKPLGGAGQGAK
jgi:hypothetical protein